MTYQLIPPVNRKPDALGDGPVIPQSVKGKYRTLKWRLLALCLTIYYVLPFLRWTRGEGQPDQAILFDLANVRFYLFWIEARAQELYYLTGLLVLATIILVLLNALAGRVWCGFLCPQTIWTDLFLLVERKLEGDRRQQMLALKQPLTLRRLIRRGVKHVLWLVIATATGGAFVLYFADAPTLLAELATGDAPMIAYGMLASLTFTTYAMAGFAREKVCTFMCPWPRLQGAIWDPEALTVTYRKHRGEQRMSAKKADLARAHGLPAGDCVDCNACVVVCPIGIDIREGPSIACINCGLCVDACDTTMARVHRPRGLIDFETWTNIERESKGDRRTPARLLRPKIIVIGLVGLVLLATMSLHLSNRATLSLLVIHDRNPVAVALSTGEVRNAYELRITNATTEEARFNLTASGNARLQIASPGLGETAAAGLPVVVPADALRKLRVIVTGHPDLAGDITFRLVREADGKETAATDRFHLP
jgi:cytochrome c oxidase accessory protein FixG